MPIRKKIQNLAAILLVLVGFGRVLAWTITSESLDDMMFRFGLSPLPIAFSHHSGHEDFVINGELIFKDDNEKTLNTIILTADNFKMLPGSWSKKGVLLITSLYAPRFNEHEVAEDIKNLGCSLFDGVSQIDLKLMSRKKVDWTFQRKYTCAKNSF